MLSEKEKFEADIPGNPNPVTELNEAMGGRVILYGHPGLCKTPEELLDSDGFQLILKHYLKQLTNQDSPILNCAKKFLAGDGYDTVRLAAFLKTLLEKEFNEKDLGDIGKVPLKDFIEELYAYWRKRERFVIFDRD